MPTAESIAAEISAFAQKLDGADGIRGERFWNELRLTAIPYLPTYLRDDLAAAHRLCVTALREIGRRNIGLGYALENHLFVVGGMETYLQQHPSPAIRRLLDQACERRDYIANTHGYVHSDRAFSEGLSLRKLPGGLRIDGQGTFMSLAGAADRLLLLLDGDEPVALFLPVKDDPSISFGDLSFPQMLVESDTRPLRCAGTFVPQELNLAIPPEHLAAAGAFATAVLAWHLSLCPGQFLGGAESLVDFTLQFARKMKSFDNRPLERLDGIVAELGQIGIKVGTAEAVLGEVAHALERRTVAAPGTPVLAETLLRAQIANQVAMEQVEEIARRCRRIIGTRLYAPAGAPFDRICAELLLGPLVPRNNSLIERDVGYVWLSRSK
jgi:alkylation response protein AidB-like acyl-CoA dehydrogenase